MNMTTPPRTRLLAIFAVLCGLLIAAPMAHAVVFNTWIGLTGLQAPTPSWVRDYSTGTPPTTVFAGTDGDGVYFSPASGVPGTWSKMGTLPADARQVYQVYTGNGKIYAVTGGGLFSTPSASPSASWTRDGGEAVVDGGLGAVPQAVMSLTAGPMLAGTVSDGVWRSVDGGNTWTPPADDNGMPQDETVWHFASFLNFVWAATSDGIYRSADQGATWTLASDGIPFGDITLNIFQDGKIPTVFYAATSNGVYRTLDAGVSWQPLDPADFPGNTQVHDLKEFTGDKETRLYVATNDGVWVATMPNIPAPGPAGGLQDPLSVTWRHMTEDGLAVGQSPNDIFWALTNFVSTPGTFLGGTQSNGGYMLIMQPPANSGQAADLPGILGLPTTQYHVGDAIVGTSGNWTGTPDIDYAYQWQHCTSSSSGSCSDINGDAATHQLYVFTAADENDHYRVCVTATNDFPEPVKALHTACSAVSSLVINAPVAPLPGSNQLEAPTIHDISPGAEDVLPTEGDTLSAPPDGALSGWSFNPAANLVGYQWQRCDVDGNNCQDIPGAKSQTYVLTSADNGVELRVIVKGSNSQGGTTVLPISGATNPIIPLPAQQLAPPKLLGNQYVGNTLTGTVGTWKSPKTTWTRQWERCEPDGSDCESIFGANGPEYTLTADDYGNTVRLRVTGDVNESFKLPLAVDAYSALSSVIQYRPGVTPPPPVQPVQPTAPTPTPTPPSPKASVSGLKLSTTSKGGKLSFKLTLSGSVEVKLEHAVSGHKVKTHCVAGRKRHAKACTAYKTVETMSAKHLKPGTHSLTLLIKVHGHVLPAGTYRAVVTPYDAGGHAGTSRTLKLVIRRR